MSKSSPDADMAPSWRRQAVAAILAAGVLRHLNVAKVVACSVPEESATSPQNCLGTGDRSRPCVPAGSGGYGPRGPEKGHRA